MPSTTIPLAMQEDLLAEVRAAAEDTGLSQADIMRQSMKLGLPRLREQLHREAGRITNVDPLPDNVLERLYRERDDDPEGIDALMAAQPIHKPE